MRKHQSYGLRMLRIKKLTQLLRVRLLKLGQIALIRLLRASHQHQQVIRPLLAKGVLEQTRRKINPPVHHHMLCLKQFPKLIHDLRGDFRWHTLQFGQLLGQALNIGLRKGAEN